MAALPGATPAINDTRPADDDPTDPEQALMLGTSTSPPSGQPGPLQAAVRDDRQAAAEKRAEKEAEKMRVDTDAVVCDSGWRFVELVSRALYLPGAKMGLAVLWVLTGFTFVLYGVVIMDEPEATDEIMDLHWIVTGVAIIDCMLMATLMLSAQDSLAVVTTDVKVSSLAALGYGEAKISTQSKTALDRWYKLFASLACASVVMGPVSVVNMNFNVGTWNFPFVREIDGKFVRQRIRPSYSMHFKRKRISPLNRPPCACAQAGPTSSLWSSPWPSRSGCRCSCACCSPCRSQPAWPQTRSWRCSTSSTTQTERTW
jgi:hypothetical protein